MNQTLIRIIVLCGFCFLLFSQNANSQEKKTSSFSLTGGQSEARATYKFSDQDVPVVDFGGTITVAVKGNELSITTPLSKRPVIAKLTGNTFKGQLRENGAGIDFQGEIVENNHTEGVFWGSFGQRKVTGLWTMKFSKKKQEPEKST